MKGNKFFSVPFDIDTNSEMRYVRAKCGGIAALLAILYEQEGSIDLADRCMEKVVAGRLELRKANQLERYLSVLAEVGWIDREAWEGSRRVFSAGVYDQLDFRKRQAERGSKGGLARARSDSDDGGRG